jgi:hypothetical protein
MKRFAAAIFSSLVFLTTYYPACGQEIFEEEPGLFATRQLNTTVSMGSPNKLMIQSALTLRGTLTVTAVEQKEVTVSYFKRSKAESESKAIDFIDLIAVRLERGAAGVRLQMSAPNPAPWGEPEAGLVDATVLVPKGCFIEVEARYFDIAAEGPFETVIIPSSLGRLEITDVTRQLKLATANRSVSVTKISGEISVATSNAELSAQEILSHGKQAHFRNDGGDIRIDGFAGELSIKNNYGRIEVSDFDAEGSKNLIRGFSGPISVAIKRITDGQVVITNGFEDVEITVPRDLSTRFSLAVDENGKIEVGNFPFRTDLVQPDRLNLVTGDGEALISASVSGEGNIFVHASDERE